MTGLAHYRPVKVAGWGSSPWVPPAQRSCLNKY
jgi:hypothetical protein